MMLDKAVQNQIGRTLRQIYAGMPKGEIPMPLWRLLLDIEQRITETDRLSRTGPSGSAGTDRLPPRPAHAAHG
jgi:hypothetical protein